MTTDQWYIKTASGQRGPYTTADLQRYVDAGAIRPNVGIGDGDGRWLAAAAIDGLVFSKEKLAKFNAGRGPQSSAESGVIRRADRGSQTHGQVAEQERADLEKREQELASREQALSAQSAELDSRASELSLLQEELRQRAEHLNQEATERDQGLDERSQTLDELSQSLEERLQGLEEREQLLSTREQELESGALEAQQGDKAIEQREAVCLELEAELDQKQADVERRDQELRQREEELQQLAQDLEGRESELSQRLEELESKVSVVDSRDEAIVAQEQELAHREEQLSEREENCEALQASLAEREDSLTERERTLEANQKGHQEQGELQERITQLEAELDAAKSCFQQWCDEDGRELDADEIREHLQSQREELETQLADVETQRTDVETQRSDIETQREDLVRQETDLAGRLAKLEASEAELKAELKDSEAASQTRAEELAREHDAVEKRRLVLVGLEEDLAGRDASLREREQNLQRNEVALEEQGNLLAEREKEISARYEEVLQQKREAELRDATTSEKSDADADLEVRRLQSELSQVESDLQSVRQQLTQREDELSLARKTIEDAPSDQATETETSGDNRSERNRILAEFADRQESLARREAELNRRESELTRRELLIDDSKRVEQVEESSPSPSQTGAERDHDFGDPGESGGADTARINFVETLDSDHSPSSGANVSVNEDSDDESQSLHEMDSGLLQSAADPEPDAVRLAEFRRSVFEERFGPCDEYFPDDDTKMRVDVSIHQPGGSRDFATMVTNGMSDYPIPMPNGQRSVRAELLLYVTHIDELAIRLIRSAAKIPYRKKQGLSIGTTGELGDEELLRSCNQKDCVYMLPVVEADSRPIAAKEQLGSSIQLFWLVTITAAERRLIDTHGIHRFLSLLEKNNHAVYFDMTRECYAKRRGWFRR